MRGPGSSSYWPDHQLIHELHYWREDLPQSIISIGYWAQDACLEGMRWESGGRGLWNGGRGVWSGGRGVSTVVAVCGRREERKNELIYVCV